MVLGCTARRYNVLALELEFSGCRDPYAFQEAPAGYRISGVEGEHPSKAFAEQLARERVIRMALQAWVKNAPDRRVILERAREGHGVLTDAFHAKHERLHTARDEPRVERRHLATGVDRETPDRRDALRVAGYNAPRDVAVPAEVFRRGVTDEIGAVLERTQEDRRRERCVDHERRVVCARDRGERVDIGDVHRRITDRFAVQHLGAFGEGRIDRGM